MTDLVRRRMVMVGAVPMTALVASAPEPRAVIVAIHGGGATSSVYFDCPGHPDLSLLRQAASLGFTAIALDRPGYGASALYQDTMDSPAERVALAWGCGRQDRPGRTGVPVGPFVGLRARNADACTNVSSASHWPAPACATTRRRRTSSARWRRPAPRRGLRQLLWEPATLYPDGIPPSSALSAPPGVRYEGAVTADWARHTFGELAAAVRVPVQFSAADHEGVWESSPEALATIAALFTGGAPGVDVSEMADSGHNLSVGLSAAEYHRRVLAFAGQCVSSAVEAEAG